MKTLAPFVLSKLPMTNEINGQITKKTIRARVFILAHDTHFDKLSATVKVHQAILYYLFVSANITFHTPINLEFGFFKHQ